MCMLIYIASSWPRDTPRFHTAEPQPKQEPVRPHLSRPHVFYAGSYEYCGCGFNFARAYPKPADDPEHWIAAGEPAAKLVRYVRETSDRDLQLPVGDEAMPSAYRLTFMPPARPSKKFFFLEQELLSIGHGEKQDVNPRHGRARRHGRPHGTKPA